MLVGCVGFSPMRGLLYLPDQYPNDPTLLGLLSSWFFSSICWANSMARSKSFGVHIHNFFLIAGFSPLRKVPIATRSDTSSRGGELNDPAYVLCHRSCLLNRCPLLVHVAVLGGTKFSEKHFLHITPSRDRTLFV